MRTYEHKNFMDALPKTLSLVGVTYNKLSTKYTHLSSPTDVIRFVHYYVRTYTAALTEEDLLAISIMTRRTKLENLVDLLWFLGAGRCRRSCYRSCRRSLCWQRTSTPSPRLHRSSTGQRRQRVQKMLKAQEPQEESYKKKPTLDYRMKVPVL